MNFLQMKVDMLNYLDIKQNVTNRKNEANFMKIALPAS